MSDPSSRGPAGRHRSTKAGWIVTGGGWLIVLLAVNLLLLRTDGSVLYGVIAAVGAVCIAIGASLSGGRASWAIPGAFAAGFLLLLGFVTTSSELGSQADGQQMTCQVTQVRPETYRRMVTDGRGRPHSEVDTRYWHTTKCPTGTYFGVDSDSSHAVGSPVEMVQVSGEQPEFAESERSATGLGMIAVGGLIALALTIGAWARSRRRAMQPVHGRFVPLPAHPHPGPPNAGAPSGPSPTPKPPPSFPPYEQR